MISIRNLKVEFQTTYGKVLAVRGSDFDFEKNKVVGIVGESGCGKSTAIFALTGILPKNATVSYEQYKYDQEEVNDLSLLRGRAISYIFQDPQSSLNPVMKISKQLAEAVRIRHSEWTDKEVNTELIRLLNEVKIPDPAAWLLAYPHQLSGGMKQRVMIAMALASEPEFLIADEPTTSLDVTIQSDILKLLLKVRESRKMGIVLITHDLNLAQKVCDQIYVMYFGKVVELGETKKVIKQSKHPYTRLLLDSVPNFEDEIHRFKEIPGQVPDIREQFEGCAFANRCPQVRADCRTKIPDLILEDGEFHSFACFHPLD